MNEDESLEDMVAENPTDDGSRNQTTETQQDAVVDISALTTVHDYTIANHDKLSNGTIINDKIHDIDQEININDFLIFNEKTNNVCVVLDCTNLYMPTSDDIQNQGSLLDMICCQSGIIMKYDNGRIYATKNNLFVIHETNGKIDRITTYYRCKKNYAKLKIEDHPINDFTNDIDMMKFAIKSRCVRLYNHIKDLDSIFDLHTKLMEYYLKVIDINNLIKIEYLRFDIGC